MALQKSHEDQQGTTHATSYSKVAVCELNTTERVANVQVHLYKDAAARAAAKRPVEVFHYRFEGTDYDALFAPAVMDPVDTNPVKLVYVELKTYDEWSTATDV